MVGRSNDARRCGDYGSGGGDEGALRCDAMAGDGGGFVYFGRLVAGLATDLHSGGEEGDARKD
jgi:hypothetical protein